MANPVLINDLRRSLFRRKPVSAVLCIAIATFVLTLLATLDVGFGRLHDIPIWNLPDLLLTVIVPAFASGSFAKENEQRTWDDLRLTMLDSWEIIRGKFLACLLPTVIAVVVLFPALAMLLMLNGVGWSLDFGPWIIILLFKFLISAFFYISLVMMCSCFFSNARTALVASYVLLAAYVFLNYLAWMVMVPSFYFLFYDVNTDAGLASSGFENLGNQSVRHFTLSPVDVACAVQALGLGMICLICLRSRTENADRFLRRGYRLNFSPLGSLPRGRVARMKRKGGEGAGG